VGRIERAAARLGDAGSAIGDNSDIFHGVCLSLSVPLLSGGSKRNVGREQDTNSFLSPRAGRGRIAQQSG
jgi:hypothetical protein